MTKEEEWMREEALRIRKKRQPDELETQGGSGPDELFFHLDGKCSKQ